MKRCYRTSSTLPDLCRTRRPRSANLGLITAATLKRSRLLWFQQASRQPFPISPSNLASVSSMFWLIRPIGVLARWPSLPYLAVESKPLQQGLTCPHSPPWCPRIWNHWRTPASVKVRWLMECSRHVQTFCWKCIVPHGFTPCYTSNQKFHCCSMTACPAAQQFPAELCSEIAIWGSNLPTCRALHSLTREWCL